MNTETPTPQERATIVKIFRQFGQRMVALADLFEKENISFEELVTEMDETLEQIESELPQ